MSLFIAGKKDGAIHRELAGFLNDSCRDGKSLSIGRTAEQAVIAYYDDNGSAIEAGKDLVFKLVPYRVRKDKNGKIRLGKRVR